MKEEWKAIEGYNGDYEISNLGRVMSYKHKVNVKILKQSLSSNGYLTVQLFNRNRKSGKTFCVHLLVWDYFGGTKRDGKQVDHKDEIKWHNEINNLQLLTGRANRSKYYQTKRDLPTGVCRSHKKRGRPHYTATCNGKYLGTFYTMEHASDAYQAELRKVTHA